MVNRAEDFVPKLARNELFYFIARICMISALPLIGFFGSRIITQADALQLAVSQQNTDIKILGFKIDRDVNQLTDHELRLRQLERKN